MTTTSIFIKDGFVYLESPYDKKFVMEIGKINSRRWRKPYNIVRITRDKKDAMEFMKIAKKFYNTPILKLPDVGLGIATYLSNSKFPESILFVTEFNQEFINDVKPLHARWNVEKMGWEMPIHTLQAVENIKYIIEKYDIYIEKSVDNIIQKKYETYKTAHDKKFKLIEMSNQTNNEGIDGIKTPPGIVLYPYQQVGVNYISTNPATGILIADDTGLGKTAQALSYCYNNEDCYPVLIVVPNCVKINWKREIKLFCESDSVEIIDGILPYKLPKVKFVIINYDIINRSSKQSKKTWVKSLSQYGFKTMIIDEAQYIKNPSSKRTVGCYNISNSKSIKKIIALSATPMLNRPIELLPLLRTLKVTHNDLETDYSFKRKYCYNGKQNGFTLWNGAQNTDKLNVLLRETCMIRRLIDDVLPELPEKIRIPVSVDIDNKNEYKDAENNFKIWYSETKNKSIDYHAEALVKIEQLRQLAVIGKMKNTIEYIENLLETKDKIIIFAHHKLIQENLFEYFKNNYKVAKIMGGMTTKERVEQEDYFQKGDANIIICSLMAANTGINLQVSDIMIFIETSFVPTQIVQAEGRNRRIGSKSKFCQYHYIIANNTIEETMLNIISYKQKLIDQTIDGLSAVDSDNNIFNELLNSL